MQNKILNQQPFLSVIVPCYNAEKYIDKCVSSIVEQTYPNLEILLINDGSADNTGTLCDAWQKKDARVRVIHQQNTGSSYARKKGVENATAEYIAFVDADDWIDKNMYAGMMAALVSTGSDIAQCGYCKVDENTSPPSPPHVCCAKCKQKRVEKPEIAGREEGVLLILEDKKWKSYLTNKIFKKHLFDNVVFPKGLDRGEDMICHHLFHHASQSVYLPDEYYYYYQTEGSLLRTDNVASQIKLQYQYAQNIYSRYLFVKKHPQYHIMLQTIKERTMVEGVISLRQMVANPQYTSDEDFQVQAKWLRAIPLCKRDALSFGFKLDIFLLKIHPGLYRMVRRFYALTFFGF